MQYDLREHHHSLIKQLEKILTGNKQKLRIKKNSISNLFRYEGRSDYTAREIDLSQFNKPLFLDTHTVTLDVQGLTTYEQIVDFVLPQGYLPLITPELKHITVGGATVGIGIEANTYKFGFVHNGLLEADVLLPDGRVVTCTAANTYKDLFYGLANSYGTLGYILRAKIKLRKVLPYMILSTTQYKNIPQVINAIKTASEIEKNDSIESLVYSLDEQYLTTARQTEIPENLISIYGDTLFYKEISKSGILSLTMKDFIFRYYPEWFWNVPQNALFNTFRKIAPRKMRNSGFYTKYGQRLTNMLFGNKENEKKEKLIQDWEVPWKYADSLVNYVLKTVNLCNLPLLLTPITVPESATLYPIRKNSLYLNVGSYSFIKRNTDYPLYYSTKSIDDFCFSHGGIKMLYSTTFLNKSKFNAIYNGKDYEKLKKKYDSFRLLPTLFEKAVQSY